MDKLVRIQIVTEKYSLCNGYQGQWEKDKGLSDEYIIYITLEQC